MPLLTDVILNGGEAGVRDRTRVESFDVVDGNAHTACSVYSLGYCNALMRLVRSLGGLIALLRMTILER